MARQSDSGIAPALPVALAAGLLFVIACGRTALVSEDAAGKTETRVPADASEQRDGGSLDGGGDAGGTVDGGDHDGGSDGGIDAGPLLADVGAATRCPHVVWTGNFPLRYTGDTSGLPNWVSSLSQAWRDYSDDSIEFLAPASGVYRFALDSGVPDIGITWRNRNGTLHSELGCPDGGYLQLDNAEIHRTSYPRDVWLDGGTRVLVWISIPAWQLTPSGPYQFAVERR